MCRKTWGMMLVLWVVCGLAGNALAETEDWPPDPNFSHAWLAYSGPETLTLMILPSGSGPYFTQARTPDGALADATITLELLDLLYQPIADFPREDIWLKAEDGGMYFCIPFGLWPDSDTDQAGLTTWFQRPRGGGHSEGPFVVFVNGNPLTTPPLPLAMNSPDINASGTVNLTDVQFFTMDIYGDYNFRSDLHRDGVVNLSDLVPLADSIGHHCN